MILDEDALLCDLAETYNIYDLNGLPLSKVALFSVGLRENSRIKKKISGVNGSMTDILLATLCDRLGVLYASITSSEKPQSILDTLINNIKENDYIVFNSIDEFEEARRKILERADKNGK